MNKRIHDPRFVTWFRHSTPYIYAHRDNILVLSFGGAALDDKSFSHLIHDIALLHSLGMKLVLVPGARPQIDELLEIFNLEPVCHNDLRVTDQEALDCVKAAVGRVRIDIEAHLSLGTANSPMAGAAIRVVSGNYVTAKPMGVIDGVDYQHTGEVRKVDAKGIKTQLDNGNIVLAMPLGYSPTGEAFNLNALDVASSIASALQADKLVFLTEGDINQHYTFAENSLLPREIEALLQSDAADMNIPEVGEYQHLLRNVVAASCSGVSRTHIINRHIDGALLGELFTRDGVGILVSQEPLEQTRYANIDDVGGVLKLIQPLENKGVLVKRSRELLEQEIERFQVIERDGAIIACAALYPFPEESLGEFACLAVHKNYQGEGRGERLLTMVETEARKMGLRSLFVLSTVTSHWFQERGFETASPDRLPKDKQELYNWQRRSKVFIKQL